MNLENELLVALKIAAKDTCELHCPSVKRSEDPWPHSERCQTLQAIIKAAEEPNEGDDDSLRIMDDSGH